MFKLILLLAMLASPPDDLAGPSARFELVWKARLPSEFIADASNFGALWLAASRRQVYVADQALDLRTGKRTRRLMRQEDNDPGFEHVLIEGGRVLLLGRYHYGGDIGPNDVARRRRIERDRALVAVDEQSGRRLWRVRGQMEPCLAALHGQVFLVLDDRLTALDAKTGKRQWQATEASVMLRGLAAGAGMVAVDGVQQGEQEAVRTFSATDGHFLWEVRLDGMATAPPAVGSKHFYSIRETCNDSRTNQCTPSITLSALDQSTGQVSWQRTFAGEKASLRSPVVANGRIHLITQNKLHALSEDTGKQWWSRRVVADDVTQDTSPVPVGDEIWIWSGDLAEHDQFAVSSTWRLIALDAATGAVRWRHAPSNIPCDGQANGPALSRPFMVENTLVFSDGYCVYRAKSAMRSGVKN